MKTYYSTSKGYSFRDVAVSFLFATALSVILYYLVKLIIYYDFMNPFENTWLLYVYTPILIVFLRIIANPFYILVSKFVKEISFDYENKMLIVKYSTIFSEDNISSLPFVYMIFEYNQTQTILCINKDEKKFAYRDVQKLFEMNQRGFTKVVLDEIFFEGINLKTE